MVRFRVLLCVLLVFALVPSVHAAATIADLYAAPSEAENFAKGSTSPVNCQDLSNLCDDTEYVDVFDVYSVQGDGSTISGTSIRNNLATAAGYLKLVYDVDGLLQGDYALRFARSTPGDFDYIICGYANYTAINVSRCEYGTVTGDDVWNEVDITNFVNRQYYEKNGRMTIRFIVDDASAQVITESYIKRPIKQSDVSIVAQGVSETEANTRVENTWSIVSQTSLPAISNGSCTLARLDNIDQNPTEVPLNFSLFNPSYAVGPNSEYFRVYWDANISVDGFMEGYNYEVECQGYLDEAAFTGFSQFVYINREKSLWESIADIVVYLLQIIGITADTNELVSAQVEMVDALIPLGGEGVATTFLTYADETVDVNASCYVDIWYPNSTQWIDGQLMTAKGSDGRYTYEISQPDVEGLYQMRSFCNGTSLMNRTRYAYANLEVYDDIIMQMVT